MDEKELIESLILYKEKYQLTLKEIAKRTGINPSNLRSYYDMIIINRAIKRLNFEGKSFKEISEYIENNLKLPQGRYGFPETSVDHWLERTKDIEYDIKKIKYLKLNEITNKKIKIRFIAKEKSASRLNEQKSNYNTQIYDLLYSYISLIYFKNLCFLKQEQTKNAKFKSVYEKFKKELFINTGYGEALKCQGSNFRLLKKLIKINKINKSVLIVESLLSDSDINQILIFLKNKILKTGFFRYFDVNSLFTELKDKKIISKEKCAEIIEYKKNWEKFSKKIKEILNKKRIEPENINGLIIDYFQIHIASWMYYSIFNLNENNHFFLFLKIKKYLLNKKQKVDILTEINSENAPLLEFLRAPNKIDNEKYPFQIINDLNENLNSFNYLKRTSLINNNLIKCYNCGNKFSPKFSIFAKDYPLSEDETIQEIQYCDNCLASMYWGTNKIDKNKEQLIEDMKKFYELTNELPSRDNLGWVQLHTFAQNDKEKFHKLMKLLISMYCPEDYLLTFCQSWIGVLIKTGLLKNAKKLYYGTICFANDDDLCLSLSEKKIDDWLFKHKIEHKKEWYYPRDVQYNPNSLLRCDWLVKDNYIEFFGLKGNENYDKKIIIKEKLCEKNNLSLISLTHKDLSNLSKKLSFLLIKEKN